MRTWRWLLSVLIVAWVVLVAGFAISSMRTSTQAVAPPAPKPGQVNVWVSPVSFTQDTGELVLSVSVVADKASLDGQGGLVNPIGITIEPALENGFVLVGAGAVPGTFQRTVLLDGSVQAYPFDRFDAPVVIAAAQSVNKAWQPLQVQGGYSQDTVAGWLIDSTAHNGNRAEIASVADADTGEVFDAGDNALIIDTTIQRHNTSIVMAIVLLALMAVLAVLALLATRAVAMGKRKQEMTMTSWFAAMIFAMLPIRLALPGVPPMGVWIDVLVTFWVFIILMLALIWWMLVWLRSGPKPG